MKLYTEEQVIHAIKMARSSTNIFTTPFLYDQYEVLEKLTPIELISDKEINEEAYCFYSLESYNQAFIQGAKWMRDKIKGGSNE